jgi:DNA helicase IV
MLMNGSHLHDDMPLRLGDVLLAEKEFNELLCSKFYLSKKALLSWKQKWISLVQRIEADIKKGCLQAQLADASYQLVRSFKNAETTVEARNVEFLEAELIKFKDLFDKVETYPLTEEQRRAIIVDEESTLVVAGAGSGKTSTILGKAAYIVKKELAAPEDILLIAFNRDVVAQMASRLYARLGIRFNVRTFHSLGLEIIAHCKGERPTVSDLAGDRTKLPTTIFEFIKARMANDENFAKKVIEYFLYYSLPYKSIFDLKSFSEYIRYIRRYDLRTLNGEKPKSFEECYIANFLYINNIKYEYKQLYQTKTAKQTKKQAWSIFYLPDHDLYIEYFTIDRENKTPPYIDRKEYTSKIARKRDVYKKHNTVLIECYHYKQQEGTLLSNLKEKLSQYDVKFNPLHYNQIFEKLNESGKVIPFLLLVSSFLNLYKSSDKTLQQLQTQTNDNDIRTKLFLEIFEKIYEDYAKYLQEKGEIDFNYMINQATDYITKKQYVPTFKYILVDEFQDISQSRYRLLKALFDHTHKLFCVGDDWQSIYRFNGSDLSITLDFEQNFGTSKKSYLEQTFRFSEKLCELSTKFVLKNPNQIKKTLRSQTKDTEPALTIIEGKTENAIEQTLSQISNQASEKGKQSVFVIGRYNFTEPKNMHQIAHSKPNLTVRYTTAHSSKGLECDYAIIVGLKSGEYGFPCQVADDPILNLVLAKKDYYPNAEERRLFYVAITRAKKHVYLIVKDKHHASDFITEIIKNDYEINLPKNNAKTSKCPECKDGQIIERKGKFGKFFACSNYPDCQYIATQCPKCQQGFIYKAQAQYRCSNPVCSFSAEICPTCKNGYLQLRKTYHASLYACSNYPKCKYIKQETNKKQRYASFTRLSL